MRMMTVRMKSPQFAFFFLMTVHKSRALIPLMFINFDRDISEESARSKDIRGFDYSEDHRGMKR